MANLIKTFSSESSNELGAVQGSKRKESFSKDAQPLTIPSTCRRNQVKDSTFEDLI
jgi:hypothetical protein